MTVARGFDVYDQMVTVAATPPPTPTTAPTAQAATMPRARGADVMLRFCAYLLTFAGALWMAALIVALTPLGRIDADVIVPFVAVFVGGIGAIAWAVLK